MLKKLIKKAPIFLSVLFLLSNNMIVFAGNAVTDQIDQKGQTGLDILFDILKWGGILAFVGNCIFLLLNKSEEGAKRGKIGMIIIIVAEMIGVLAPKIIPLFQ